MLVSDDDDENGSCMMEGGLCPKMTTTKDGDGDETCIG